MTGISAHFGDRLSHHIEQTGSVLCMGLDPHLGLMPALFGSDAPQIGSVETISAIERFAMAAIEVAAGQLPAIKPQVALFEQHGPEGMALLAKIGTEARRRNLLCIMDAKRGDIGSTSAAYASAWMGAESVFAGDALTINAYMGLDSITPYLERARDTGSGVFILLRTSNPGAADIQGLHVDNKPVFHHLSDLLKPEIEAQTGQSGLSSVGMVVGATWPEEAAELRQVLPQAPFLIPGFGAQGADAQMACSGLTQTENHYSAGLVNASRGLTFTPELAEASSLADWQDRLAAKISEMKAGLRP